MTTHTPNYIFLSINQSIFKEPLINGLIFQIRGDFASEIQKSQDHILLRVGFLRFLDLWRESAQKWDNGLYQRLLKHHKPLLN